MFNWLKSKNETSKSNTLTPPTPLDVSLQFMREYETSENKDLYAIATWGIDKAFNKIFGGLDQYNSAEPSKKAKYLQMMATHALDHLKKDEPVLASCNQFYINYLVALQGVSRNKLRGTIEQIADKLDGIVRYGDQKQRELAAIEESAREFFSNNETFKIGSGSIKGPVTERAANEVSVIILADLQSILKTNEDYYWFLIEYHDFLTSKKSAIRTMLDGFSLFSIEYEDMRSVDSYVGKENPGILCMKSIHSDISEWCLKRAPTLDANELSTRILSLAYTHFRTIHKQSLDKIRLDYAVHYHNNCISTGNYHSADKWNAVIAAVS